MEAGKDRTSAPAHARGADTVPLFRETIGANLDRTIERFGNREALVSYLQDLRLTYAQLGAAVDELGRGLLAAGIKRGDRVGIWSPNCAEWVLVQYATAKTGVILVNINPAYRTSELEYALRQSGCRMLISAPAFKTSDYRAMVAEVRPSLPDLEQVVFLDSEDWEQLLAGAQRVGVDQLEASARAARARGSDQHPVHERDDRLSQGRDAQPSQHPQQRLLHRRGLPLHRARSSLHPGAVLPLFRDGAREPRVHHAWCRDRDPGAGV